MGAAIAIRRVDLDATGLRRAAARSRDSDAARRMLALALVMEGVSRTQAAEQCGMDRQTLRDWVHRYNEEGLAGLSSRASPGAPARLNEAQQREVLDLVLTGPDLKTHGVVRWRRIDLSREIERRFGVHLAELSVGTLLRRLGQRRLSVRPAHPERDIAAQEAHKKTFPN